MNVISRMRRKDY